MVGRAGLLLMSAIALVSAMPLPAEDTLSNFDDAHVAPHRHPSPRINTEHAQASPQGSSHGRARLPYPNCPECDAIFADLTALLQQAGDFGISDWVGGGSPSGSGPSDRSILGSMFSDLQGFCKDKYGRTVRCDMVGRYFYVSCQVLAGNLTLPLPQLLPEGRRVRDDALWYEWSRVFDGIRSQHC